MISKRHMIQLECLYLPKSGNSPSVTSRHVVICVSGFLSETGEMESSWTYLVNECRAKGVPLYAVRWESKDQSQMEGIAIEKASQNLTPMLFNTKKVSDLFSTKNLKSVGKFIGETLNDGTETFKQARSNAKVTGKLLAHFLALENGQSSLFRDQTFSLIGFSLGSQVCKSTVNRLHKLGKDGLIHNVYFLAGATYISPQKQKEQKETFIQAVSGKISNVHTLNDTTLSMFETIYKNYAIGR